MTARSRIGGTLHLGALTRLHFSALTQEQQAAAIRRLAAAGRSVDIIASATGLSVEQIRRVLADEPRSNITEERQGT